MQSIDTVKGASLVRPGRMTVFFKKLRQYPTTLFGGIILLVFLFFAIFGPLIAPYPASEQNAADRLQKPSAAHLLGTDQFGRDLFSRIMIGSRDVFSVAGIGTLIAIILGLTVGLVSGYYGGLLDEVVMRLLDVLMSIPPLMLAMVTLGALGPSRKNVILVVGILFIPLVARVVRSVVLDLKTREYVESARLQGESGAYVMFREIFPNVLPALAVEGSMRFTYAIFLVASLGFLGLGVQPPSPDWGLMVADGREQFYQSRWILLYPAGAIALLVVGLGFFSDGLRRILVPGGVSE
jgi:peptide/nickel transport system permease protein